MYIDDLVEGLITIMNSNYSRPINLGNPEEYRITELADVIRNLIGNQNPVIKLNRLEDDPRRRKPDITAAKAQLKWAPKTSLIDGLHKTVSYFKKILDFSKNPNNDDAESINSNYFSENQHKIDEL